jgi:hypothetical protein
MLSYPTVATNPGLEDWRSGEEWSRETVFHSLLQRWDYSKEKLQTATSAHGPKDSWEALRQFYASHQSSSVLPPMPVTLTTAMGDTIPLAGVPCTGGWHGMWRKLLQFSAPAAAPAAHVAHALAAPAAPARPRAVVPAGAPARLPVVHVPDEPDSEAQRASEVNVVGHSGYTPAIRAAQAAKERLSKKELWEKVTNSFAMANLFWIALPHFEGELRVGLGHITLENLDGSIQRDDAQALSDTAYTCIWRVVVYQTEHDDADP